MTLAGSIKRLFNSAGNSTPIADMATPRADGYSVYNARVVCAFQMEAESMGAQCDYDALRSTLQYARGINEFKLTPIGLMARYNAIAESVLSDRK